MDFAHKHIIVIGAGISGFAASKILAQQGADVVLADLNENLAAEHDLSELTALGVKFHLGKQSMELFQNADLVVISPAVPRHLPLLEELTIPVIGEVELAYLLSQAPIYAITGTNGKTTTTMLLGELMKTIFPKDKVGIGGNIGIPLCEQAIHIPADGCIVAEISSYQLESTSKFKTKGCAILNLTPDHLKRHHTMEQYKLEKEKIFANHQAADFVVLNADDPWLTDVSTRVPGKVYYFSVTKKIDNGAYLEGDALIINDRWINHYVCKRDELQIKGLHNVENALAALLIAYHAGGDIATMAKVLTAFCPVEHRIEPVATIDGISYYNDSKATNPEASIKAIASFEHLILIAGGDDKLTPLDDFYTVAKKHVDILILVGDGADRFAQEALKHGFTTEQIYRVGYDMSKAVELAYQLAHIPQTVLLSPACASFDMYRGYEERGRHFKDLVHALATPER